MLPVRKHYAGSWSWISHSPSLFSSVAVPFQQDSPGEPASSWQLSALNGVGVNVARREIGRLSGNHHAQVVLCLTLHGEARKVSSAARIASASAELSDSATVAGAPSGGDDSASHAALLSANISTAHAARLTRHRTLLMG